MTRIDGGTQIEGRTQIEAYQGDSKVVSIAVELEDVEQLVLDFVNSTDSTATAVELQIESYKIDFLTTNPISVGEKEITELGTFYTVTQQNSRDDDGAIADHIQFDVPINTKRAGSWIYKVKLDVTYTDSTDGSGPSQTKTITQMLIPDGTIEVTTTKHKGSTTLIADENVVIDADIKLGLKSGGKGVIEIDNATNMASYGMSHQNAAELSELTNKAYVDEKIAEVEVKTNDLKTEVGNSLQEYRNEIDAKIGDIESVLDSINSGNGGAV